MDLFSGQLPGEVKDQGKKTCLHGAGCREFLAEFHPVPMLLPWGFLPKAWLAPRCRQLAAATPI